ncbi:hypothetical protein [Rappaport israeli]|uniref:hypothetical protein n=1 Tax=Rappaport israeli TaxID=1839807 RepID=UPI0009300DE1|nr:hypothetical protein [Rappaport israeli]
MVNVKFNKLVGLMAGFCLSAVWAQQANEPLELQHDVFYKWQEKGIAHYSKTMPRGVGNYIILNKYGMVVFDSKQSVEPDLSLTTAKAVRPMPHDSNEMNSFAHEENVKSNRTFEMPSAARAKEQEQIITREQRCEEAQEQLTTIRQNEVIYEEDKEGNLIPLDQQTVNARREQAENDIRELCH